MGGGELKKGRQKDNDTIWHSESKKIKITFKQAHWIYNTKLLPSSESYILQKV